MALFHIFLGMILLFFTLLLVKNALKFHKKEFCVICATVSLTWIILLLLLRFGSFDNKVIIALLMGQSITGIFYFLEHKFKDKISLFRLPILLTLTFFGYSLIERHDFVNVTYLLSVLWTAFAFLHASKKNRNFENFVKKIIECCKRW